MKNKYIISLLIFISVYILTLIFLFFRIKITYDILIHFIFSVAGMISIVILNLREKSAFVIFFTIVSFFFYVSDSFYPVCYSLIKCENMLLKNTSFLSHTEGFLMFCCTGYLLLVIFRENKM